jgi:hypothetical protein
MRGRFDKDCGWLLTRTEHDADVIVEPDGCGPEGKFWEPRE